MRRVLASSVSGLWRPATPASLCSSAAWRARAGAVRVASTWTDSDGYERFGPSRAHPMGGRGLALLAGAAASGVAYWWSCRQEVPWTHRRHAILFVSERLERDIGRQTWAEVTQQAAANHSLLPAHHPAARLVQRVGRRIAGVAADGSGGGYSQHMQGLDWEFAVIQSPDVNAFVLPGGKVVAFTGLLSLMQSEDELAGVLAHEAAHVLARHHAERLSQLNVTGLLNMLVRALLGVSIPGALAVLTVFLPYSRAAEHEADAIGIRLMAKACFDPDAMVTMLAKLQAIQAKQGEAAPELLSTHPLTLQRVQRMRQLLAEAYALRSAHCESLQAALEQFVHSVGV